MIFWSAPQEANAQNTPTVTALDNGGFFVTWSSSNGTDFDIRGALFNADGTRAAINGSTNDVLISTTTAHDRTPVMTELANGNFAVAWASLDAPVPAFRTNVYTIHGRIFAADGSPIAVNGSTNDFVMNTPSSFPGGSTASQLNPSLTALADGGFVATWDGPPPGFGTISQVRGRFNAEWQRPIGKRLNERLRAFGGQHGGPGFIRPAGATLPNGLVVEGWLDDGRDQVHARLFNPNGTPASFNGSTAEFSVGSYREQSSRRDFGVYRDAA